MTKYSIAALRHDGLRGDSGDRYSIVFAEDGSCSFRSVLEDFSGGEVKNIEGKWGLHHDTHGNSNIRKDNAIEMQLQDGEMERWLWLNFDRRDGRLVLWSFYGDPDSWEFIEYVKEEAPPEGSEDAQPNPRRRSVEPQEPNPPVSTSP
jgi:hypothetical protein